MFSGGAGSWAAAKRTVARFGAENTVLLFGDTLIEDEDLYRFLDQAAADVGAPLVKLADGRTPWQVFKDVRYIGNTRVDPCSKILKRDLLRKWVEEHRDPADTAIVLGIDWTEIHRFENAKRRWGADGWTVLAPLCDETDTDKASLLQEMKEAGIDPPRLYDLGFPHNNCGGFCVKAGQAQFAHLLKVMPERYAQHAKEEEGLRVHLGKDVSILRDRRGGTVKPLTMVEFAKRVTGEDYDPDDWGGCGCFLDDEETGA
jgi:3'-phosphoadenosine 5'-phosphosulfate sulfotransferase (PAPS reductase)/FAD synthetase